MYTCYIQILVPISLGILTSVKMNFKSKRTYLLCFVYLYAYVNIIQTYVL